MAHDLRLLVCTRAKNRCEYCHLPQELFPAALFHLDHVIPKQHEGTDGPRNRSLSCSRCNLNKGPNLATRDNRTKRLVPLFNPRRQKWSRHFRWRGAVLVGLTVVGRGTIKILGINEPDRIELRRNLIAEGVFPFPD